MKNKLANLGLALSRDAQKKIIGGELLFSPSCGDECSTDQYCSSNSSCSKCKKNKCSKPSDDGETA